MRPNSHNKPAKLSLFHHIFKPVVVAASLYLLAASNWAAASTGLSIETGFDNNHINSRQPGQRYLEVLVTAPIADRYQPLQQRLPLNIALVIDSSGSMAHQDKMRHVKEATLALLDKLQPGDRFALITYANYARVLISSEPVEDLYQARALINSIRPGGSTNLLAGIEQGYREVSRSHTRRAINRVLLFSDGLANIGITSPARLGQIVQHEAEKGISLSTFGVGLDFNENLMAALSETGLGMYYFIDSPRSINDILAREFTAVEQVVASDIRIEVSLKNDIEICQVMANRYEIRGNKIIMYGGDLSAGERRRFQIRIKPPAHKRGSYRAGGVKMTFRPAGQDHIVTSQDRLKLHYLADSAKINKGLNRAISQRSAVFEAHYARSKAAEAVDRGDLHGAQAILDKAREAIDKKAQNSSRIKKELSEIDTYAAALRKPLNSRERDRIQKSVKYDSYILEGC